MGQVEGSPVNGIMWCLLWFVSELLMFTEWCEIIVTSGLG